jgi:TonB family protein
VRNILEVLKCFLWFLPPVWFIVSKSYDLAEHACDDEVIAKKHDRALYAEDILELSAGMRLDSLQLSITGGCLSNRLDLILESARTRLIISPSQKIAYILILYLALAPFFMLKLVQQHETDQYIRDVSFHLLQNSSRTEKTKAEPILLPPYRSQKVVEEVRVRSPYGYKFPIKNNIDSKFDIASDKVINIPNVSVIGIVPHSLMIPDYPHRAINNNIEATITAIFDIDTSGNVNSIRFKKNKHLQYFQKSITRALKSSTYIPPEINGKKIELVEIQETFRFELNNKQ